MDQPAIQIRRFRTKRSREPHLRSSFRAQQPRKQEELIGFEPLRSPAWPGTGRYALTHTGTYIYVVCYTFIYKTHAAASAAADRAAWADIFKQHSDIPWPYSSNWLRLRRHCPKTIQIQVFHVNRVYITHSTYIYGLVLTTHTHKNKIKYRESWPNWAICLRINCDDVNRTWKRVLSRFNWRHLWNKIIGNKHVINVVFYLTNTARQMNLHRSKYNVWRRGVFMCLGTYQISLK